MIEYITVHAQDKNSLSELNCNENGENNTMSLDDCDKGIIQNDIITIKVVENETNKFMLFYTDKKILNHSGYFNTLISFDNEEKCVEFSTDIISFDGMKLLLKFLLNTYQLKSTPTDIKLKRIDVLTDLFEEWEAKFIDKVYELGYLNEILRISNYFDVHILLYLACAKNALIIRNINIRLVSNLKKIDTQEFDKQLTDEINNRLSSSSKMLVNFDEF